MSVLRPALTLAALFLCAGTLVAAECKPPRTPEATVLGMTYCVDPAFAATIATRVQQIRADVRAQRQAGKFIIYASTPISSRGGGNERVNLEVSASVKARLEREYGPAVWVLDPGAYQMPPVGGRSPGGDEYMLMWAQVLAGDDGAGRDFDLVHFTGPGDMRAFFGCGGDDVTGCIDRYAQSRATADGDFRRTVATDPVRRSAFVRYYALRASSAFSKGAHDEWNIVVRINRRRALGEQVAVFFDGRAASPAGMETEISPGYEVR